MEKQLSVRLYGKTIGILEQTTNGKMRFRYNDDADQAISNSLKLDDNKKQFTYRECLPYFNGLLPEDAAVKQRIGKIFGVNPNNDFALLQAIGHDCAGAVSLHDTDETEQEADFVDIEGTSLTDSELKEYIEELPQRPLFLDINNDVRLSLAGAQEKAAVSIIDNKICLPNNSTPSTHILKPVIKGLDNTVLNEYICMKSAKRVGIEVAEVEFNRIDDVCFILIERYDRDYKGSKIKRIHQEDFCQALGVLSINKYQTDGGPGIKQCFDLLGITDVPAKNRNNLMRLMMYNFIIGNNDAHAKNFSILYKNKIGTLAPAYDLLSTRVYSRLSNKMAMKIDGEYNPNRIKLSHWENLCAQISYAFPSFREEFVELAKEINSAFNEEVRIASKLNSNSDLYKKILGLISENCKRVNELFS